MMMVRRSGQQQQTRSRGEAKHDQHIKLQLKWEVNVEMICIKRTTNVDKLTRAACRDLSSYYKSQHLIITIFLFDYIWKWKCRLFFLQFYLFSYISLHIKWMHDRYIKILWKTQQTKKLRYFTILLLCHQSY